MTVSYTHLDVYKRQGLQRNDSQTGKRTYKRQRLLAGSGFGCGGSFYPAFMRIQISADPCSRHGGIHLYLYDRKLQSDTRRNFDRPFNPGLPDPHRIKKPQCRIFKRHL